MKTLRKKSLLYFFSLLVASCSPIYYAPNAHNVPLFKEKNELKLSGHYSLGEDVKSVELQTAYSLDTLFAIQLNGMRTIDNEKAFGSYVELALGYYKNLPQNWVFEIYAGFGSGRVNWQYGDSYSNNFGLANPSSSMNFNKIYMQPSIGYSGSSLDFAFSYRIGILSYNSIVLNDIPDGNNYDIYILNGSHLMSEPAVTLRFGEELVKLQVQLGYSKDLQNPAFKYNQDNWNLNIGLRFNLSTKKWF